MVAIGNKQYKQINNKHTKQFLMTKKQYQQMLLIATNA
jgi:hypothetical protein